MGNLGDTAAVRAAIDAAIDAGHLPDIERTEEVEEGRFAICYKHDCEVLYPPKDAADRDACTAIFFQALAAMGTRPSVQATGVQVRLATGMPSEREEFREMGTFTEQTLPLLSQRLAR